MSSWISRLTRERPYPVRTVEFSPSGKQPKKAVCNIAGDIMLRLPHPGSGLSARIN